MAMNDLPEQSHKELRESKRGAEGEVTLSLFIKCYLRQPGSSAAPSAHSWNPRMGLAQAGPASVPPDGGPGTTLFPGKRSRDTVLPGQVHSHGQVDRDCVSVELKDEQGQRGQGRGSQASFRVPISSLLVHRGPNRYHVSLQRLETLGEQNIQDSCLCCIYVLLDPRYAPTVPATEGAGKVSEWPDGHQAAVPPLNGRMKLTAPRAGQGLLAKGTHHVPPGHQESPGKCALM